jgi:hypothetical protein
MLWAGIDVGGRKKGFHCALVGGERLIEVAHLRSASDVVTWLREREPSLVAIDSWRLAGR